MKVYIVLGVAGTGSGSLTYPEDFDIVEAYSDPLKAQAECDRRNAENGFTGAEDEDLDDDLRYALHYDVEAIELKN